MDRAGEGNVPGTGCYTFNRRVMRKRG